MWVIVKYNKKELETVKENFKKKLGNEIKFYNPKIKYQRYLKGKLQTFAKDILENYLLCYHPSFSNSKSLHNLKYQKGLEYFLEGYLYNQSQILNFITHCQLNENSEGFLNQTFFQNLESNKAKFVSGPFTDMIFTIIENQKNKLKILIGNVTTTINKHSGYLYRPV